MLYEYVFERRFHVMADILPALDVLRVEHRFTEGDFTEIASRSPIVPIGRERLFGKALLAGIEHDFAGALHVPPGVKMLTQTYCDMGSALGLAFIT